MFRRGIFIYFGMFFGYDFYKSICVGRKDGMIVEWKFGSFVEFFEC